MNLSAVWNFDFLSPNRLVFGWGRREEAGRLAKSLGERAFIISGSRTLEKNGHLDELHRSLRAAGVEPVAAGCISREPEVDDVDRVLSFLREHRAGAGDLVIGIGGGSAIDLAKAVAALMTNTRGNSVVDYLEGVGKGLTIDAAPLPLFAIPTTAGTGSEATKNAVISSYHPPFKKSLRSDQMVPRLVLIDPQLSVSVPPPVTAWTGMDAITQLIESFLSRRAQPIPQALALHALEFAVPALIEAYENGHSRVARERMAYAAYLSGLSLANSGLGLAHGVAAALGVHCRVPHGLACAVMLPVALRENVATRPAEIAQLGRVLSGQQRSSESEDIDAALQTVENLCDRLRIPRRLGEIGVRREQIPELVRSSRGNSMSGNPREISDEELHQILERLL